MNSEQAQASLVLYLDLCAKNERMCAELYHYYSDLFRERDDISQLWKKTALEEENHQKQFELALRLSTSCDLELTSSVERALSVHQTFLRLLDHVRMQPPDLLTALKKAIEMEEAIADIHLESSVVFKDSHVYELFRAMCDADQGHVESLKMYLAVVELPLSDMRS